MTSEISQKLTEMETRYAEQAYTIHALNDVVSRQDREITRLSADLQCLKQQLIELKAQIPDTDASASNEMPPHY